MSQIRQFVKQNQLLKPLVWFLGLIVLGFTVAFLFDASKAIEAWIVYIVVVRFLLTGGLYAATYGITWREFSRRDIRIIGLAITIGVLGKSAAIGFCLMGIFGDPHHILIGVALAQIDPLIITLLTRGERLSEDAKRILLSWASFDDPVTVVITALLLPLWFSTTEGISFQVNWEGIVSIPVQIVLALFIVAVYLGLIKIITNLLKRKGTEMTFFVEGTPIFTSPYNKWILAGVFGVVGIIFFILMSTLLLFGFFLLMLGVGIIGCLVRPQEISNIIDVAVTWTFRAVSILLGVMFFTSIKTGGDIAHYLWIGLIAGMLAYWAQVIAGFALTGGLPWKDRVHIAFAQMNGLTAANLALVLEPMIPGAVVIILTAIIVIYVHNMICNRIIDNIYQN